ncbi:putative S-adenosyl-L-methionine-dependent methyltransferase [Helicosporidium sp. ATCC 50920]|nr:putative S-adenosyl-L-methionine-dependent methyltransferase [Helicosporidium sp. ATCC 50920]|eukprot:KDD76562.1 putative S-adenosyl-L-methionine-dependent methyltransferase [Helicosporidium sp. ATCC 50920]
MHCIFLLLHPRAPSLRIHPLQVRNFLHESLYSPSDGYFSTHPTIGSMPTPLEFATYRNQADYLRKVQEAYVVLQSRWLTPVEIFKPHYGRAIARWALNHWGVTGAGKEERGGCAAAAQDLPPLFVYEIGGGTGTMALDFLDYVREFCPKVYATCRYTCVEISPLLAEAQAERVGKAHGSRFQVCVGDATVRSTWKEDSADPCLILAFEVLDNLPHDKVVWSSDGKENERSEDVVHEEGVGSRSCKATAFRNPPPSTQPPTYSCGKHAFKGELGQADSRWRQVVVEKRATGRATEGSVVLSEKTVPITDPLTLRCLTAHESLKAPSRRKSSFIASLLHGILGPPPVEPVWLPTGALQLMDTLCAVRPNHTLLAADFDELPDVVVPGVHAPLVASTERGKTLDHATYLLPPGTADIFFPTNFELLGKLYRQAAARGQGGGEARALKSAEFMKEWAEEGATAVADGYQPLTEDYTNTSVLVGTCRARA